MRVECEKPVLAGVNGVAVGLGLSLAMNADIRIAAPSARFHPGYARVGTSPDGGLTWTLTRAVGYERAMRFLLEQRMVSAPEAHALGLVSEIAETDDAFEQRFLDYGQMLAGVAPLAARQTKRLLVRVDSPPDLATHLDDEINLALHGLASDDSKEAVRAIVSKERPEFTGPITDHKSKHCSARSNSHTSSGTSAVPAAAKPFTSSRVAHHTSDPAMSSPGTTSPPRYDATKNVEIMCGMRSSYRHVDA